MGNTQLSALCAAHCAAQNLAKKSRFLKFCEKMTQKSRFFSPMSAPCTSRTKKQKKHSTATPRTPRKKHTIVSTLRGALRGAEFGEKITIFEMLRKNDPKISIFSPMSAPCTSRTKKKKKNSTATPRTPRKKHTIVSTLRGALRGAEFGEKITIFEMLRKNDPKISIFS